MSTYLSFDVLDVTEPSRDGQIQMGYERRFVLLDNETGKRKSDALSVAPAPARPFLWICHSRADVSAMRTFLDARKGRAVPFWLPSYQQDMTLAADLGSGISAVTIKRFGYGTLMFPPSGARRHLAFYQRSGNLFDFRKVIGANDPGSGATESLTISSGVSRAYPAASTVVMFLTLCRLEEDRYTIEWLSGSVAQCRLQIREIPLEAPS